MRYAGVNDGHIFRLGSDGVQDVEEKAGGDGPPRHVEEDDEEERDERAGHDGGRLGCVARFEPLAERLDDGDRQ